MSVTIRLARTGKRNAPAFKIVAANTRDKRNGRYLDILGHFNPSTKPTSYNLDEKKYAEWIKKGALVSTAVEQLKEGKYVFKPYKGGKAENASQPSKTVQTTAQTQSETAAQTMGETTQ